MYELISAAPSPYARKVRIALAEKGIPFRLLTEVPWDATTTTPRHNPLEKVPVLLLEDGGSVYESAFVLEWLELKHPDPPLVSASVEERLAARRLEVLADGVCDALVLVFLERRRATPSAPWIDRQMRKVAGGLGEMSRLLGGRDWAVGDRFGLGDIAIGVTVGYLGVRFPEIPLAERHPNLAAHAARLEERPSFAGSRPAPQTISDAVV